MMLRFVADFPTTRQLQGKKKIDKCVLRQLEAVKLNWTTVVIFRMNYVLNPADRTASCLDSEAL